MEKASEKILILDFGSQYTQLIARRVRELKVYCEIHPFNIPMDTIRKFKPSGIILSGGPASCLGKDAPLPDKGIFDLKAPVLGICYGMQLMAYMLDGKVLPSSKAEYGPAFLTIDDLGDLFKGVLTGSGKETPVWMSHGDRVDELPEGFEPIAHSSNSPYAAMRDPSRKFYAVQFHPEVHHTEKGETILKNFLYDICGSTGKWTMANFIETSVNEIRGLVDSDSVIMAISGGVDSSVAATLIKKAIGDKLVGIFVDNGLLRKNEGDKVEAMLKDNIGINLKKIEATDRFLKKLEGIEDPEAKRKIIGNEFIAVFEEEADKVTGAKWLAQGTLYPDVIESVSFKGPSATIKSHHNVGGLPDNMNLKLIEPLRELFKDEVRVLGRELGLPSEVVDRQPFPGPGLAVRILGEVTKERLDILRDADDIVVSEIKEAGLYHEIWQSFAVLLPVRTVGVMGDERTYEDVIAIRAVTSRDGMTADWARIPDKVLAKMSSRIINEVRGVNRVVYDISSKPPGTIEWE